MGLEFSKGGEDQRNGFWDRGSNGCGGIVGTVSASNGVQICSRGGRSDWIRHLSDYKRKKAFLSETDDKVAIIICMFFLVI